MKSIQYNSSVVAVIGTFVLLLVAVTAAPMLTVTLLYGVAHTTASVRHENALLRRAACDHLAVEVPVLCVDANGVMVYAACYGTSKEPDEEQSENMVVRSGEGGEGEDMGSWDAVDTAALRKLLMQLDAEERLGIGARVNRAWPQAEPRGWGLRQLRPIDGRLARQWRADKRQVRFRQCYFNPISCFRK